MAVSTIKSGGFRPTTLSRPLSADLKSGAFSFTAPSDGVLYVCVISTARQYFGIQWNGASIGDVAQNPTTNNSSAITIPLFLKKGDVITASTFNANCYVVASRTCFISLS